MLMHESLWKQMTDRGLLTGLRSQPLPDISTEHVKETLKTGDRVVICWPRSQHNGAPFPNSAVELFHIATVGKVGVVQAINTTFNYVSINVGNHDNAFYGFNAIVPIPEDIKTKPYIDPISQVMFDKMAVKGWVTGSRAKPIPRLAPDVVEGMLSVGDKALVCWPLSPYSGERCHESYLSADHLGTVGIVGVVYTIDLGVRLVKLRFGNVRVDYSFDSVVPLPKEENGMRLISEPLFTKMIDLALVTGFRHEPVGNVTPGWVGERVKIGSKVLVVWPKSTDGDGTRRDESLLHGDHLAYIGRVVQIAWVEHSDHLVMVRIADDRFLHLKLDSIVPIPDEKTILKTGDATSLVEDVGQTVTPKKISTSAEAAAAFGEPGMYPEGLAPNQLIDQLIEGGYIIVNQFRPLSCLCWRDFAENLKAGQQVFLCYPTLPNGAPDRAVGESVMRFVGSVATIRKTVPGKSSSWVVVMVGSESVSWATSHVVPLPLSKSSQPKSVELPPWDILAAEPKLRGETDGDYAARQKEKYTVRIDLGQASYDRSGEAYIADFRDWMNTPMISRRRG